MNTLSGNAVSLASLAVALVTTLFVLYQARLTRIHNVLSVRPHLAMEICSGYDENKYSVEVRLFNFGLGPALVKSHKVFFDRHLIGSTADIASGRAALETIERSFEERDFHSSIFSRDTAMRAGEERSLVGFVATKKEGSNFDAKETRFYADIVRFDAEIEYECMYVNKFKLDTRGLSVREKA